MDEDILDFVNVSHLVLKNTMKVGKSQGVNMLWALLRVPCLDP